MISIVNTANAARVIASKTGVCSIPKAIVFTSCPNRQYREQKKARATNRLCDKMVSNIPRLSGSDIRDFLKN
jgi:hypothetical protein